MKRKIKKACINIRDRFAGAPSEIQKAERVLIDTFEFENNHQFTSVDVVAVGDLYELWVNEERIYRHLCLHKVYRRALVELEAKYRGIEHE